MIPTHCKSKNIRTWKKSIEIREVRFLRRSLNFEWLVLHYLAERAILISQQARQEAETHRAAADRARNEAANLRAEKEQWKVCVIIFLDRRHSDTGAESRIKTGI